MFPSVGSVSKCNAIATIVLLAQWTLIALLLATETQAGVFRGAREIDAANRTAATATATVSTDDDDPDTVPVRKSDADEALAAAAVFGRTTPKIESEMNARTSTKLLPQTQAAAGGESGNVNDFKSHIGRLVLNKVPNSWNSHMPLQRLESESNNPNHSPKSNDVKEVSNMEKDSSVFSQQSTNFIPGADDAQRGISNGLDNMNVHFDTAMSSKLPVVNVNLTVSKPTIAELEEEEEKEAEETLPEVERTALRLPQTIETLNETERVSPASSSSAAGASSLSTARHSGRSSFESSLLQSNEYLDGDGAEAAGNEADDGADERFEAKPEKRTTTAPIAIEKQITKAADEVNAALILPNSNAQTLPNSPIAAAAAKVTTEAPPRQIEGKQMPQFRIGLVAAESTSASGSETAAAEMQLTQSHENAVEESQSAPLPQRIRPSASSSKAIGGPISAEKRAKFINDNSTSAQQMNLPDGAEVWTLAGMKMVPHTNASAMKDDMLEQGSQIMLKTEPAVAAANNNDEDSNNDDSITSHSEKNLLDWTQIMLNGEMPSTSSTMAPNQEEEAAAAAAVFDEERIAISNGSAPLHTHTDASSTAKAEFQTELAGINTKVATDAPLSSSSSSSTHLSQTLNEISIEATSAKPLSTSGYGTIAPELEELEDQDEAATTVALAIPAATAAPVERNPLLLNATTPGTIGIIDSSDKGSNIDSSSTAADKRPSTTLPAGAEPHEEQREHIEIKSDSLVSKQSVHADISETSTESSIKQLELEQRPPTTTPATTVVAVTAALPEMRTSTIHGSSGGSEIITTPSPSPPAHDTNNAPNSSAGGHNDELTLNADAAGGNDDDAAHNNRSGNSRPEPERSASTTTPLSTLPANEANTAIILEDGRVTTTPRVEILQRENNGGESAGSDAVVNKQDGEQHKDKDEDADEDESSGIGGIHNTVGSAGVDSAAPTTTTPLPAVFETKTSSGGSNSSTKVGQYRNELVAVSTTSTERGDKAESDGVGASTPANEAEKEHGIATSVTDELLIPTTTTTTEATPIQESKTQTESPITSTTTTGSSATTIAAEETLLVVGQQGQEQVQSAANTTTAAAPVAAVGEVDSEDAKANAAAKNVAHETESSIETNAIDPLEKTVTVTTTTPTPRTADKQAETFHSNTTAAAAAATPLLSTTEVPPPGAADVIRTEEKDDFDEEQQPENTLGEGEDETAAAEKEEPAVTEHEDILLRPQVTSTTMETTKQQSTASEAAKLETVPSTTPEAPLFRLLPNESTTTEPPKVDITATTTTTTPSTGSVVTKPEEIYSVFSTTTAASRETTKTANVTTTPTPTGAGAAVAVETTTTTATHTTDTTHIHTTTTAAPALPPKYIEGSASVPIATTILPPIVHATIGGAARPTLQPAADGSNLQPMHPSDAHDGTDVNVIIAISVSVIGVVALILLVAFLYLMRKRQKQMSYGQRCRPVSLDAYSLDNVSVLGSVRRKGASRTSKRSYGNVAFDDPALRHNVLNATELAKFVERRSSIFEEFRDVPQIIARADEVPAGCEDKNRYANVIPLPETRVILQQQNNDDKTEYINANYVRGPKDAPNYYIACQAPLESTVADFWRMVWEQQSRVIVQATDLTENGIEKCAEYLPPSTTLDNHTTYGDFQVTLKNRDVKDKYAISTVLLKNALTDASRELTHYWYKWPETGVPGEEAPIIAMLLEVRSSLKSYAIEQANELRGKSSSMTLKVEDASLSDKMPSVTSNGNGERQAEEGSISSASGSNSNSNSEINGNVSASDKLKAAARNQGPLTIHCSPGTGRTGTIISCDMAIRSLETPTRSVDIPQIVYYVRRGRASAVQTKEQYEFIYKVANMYATKITVLSNDN